MDAAIPADGRAPADAKPATFGTVSLAFAVLTIVLPLAVMLFFGQKADQEERSGPHGGLGALLAIFVGVVFAAVVSGLSGLVGTITGVVSLARGERSAWRPVVGLVVNAPVLAVVAYAVIVARMSNGG